MADRGADQLPVVCVHAAALTRGHPMANQRPESEAQVLEFRASNRISLVQRQHASRTQLLQDDEVMLGQVVIMCHGWSPLQRLELELP